MYKNWTQQSRKLYFLKKISLKNTLLTPSDKLLIFKTYIYLTDYMNLSLTLPKILKNNNQK